MIWSCETILFLSYVWNYKKEKQIEKNQKFEEGGDAKHVYFFTRPKMK